MEKSKKKKLKKIIKERWLLLAGTILFFIGGLIALLVGFAMTGWSIIEWLKSPYATTCFILLAGAILTFVMVFITYKRSHLGD